MRTVMPGTFAAPSIPLLDSTYLPAAEDWAVVESLGNCGFDGDPDDDRFAAMSVGADSFE